MTRTASLSSEASPLETESIDINTEDDKETEVVIAAPVEAPVEEEEEEVVFVVVETMPEFPGGQQALFKYLSENVKYPVIAQENGILQLRHLLRHHPRRPRGRHYPRRYAGGCERRPRQLDDPRQIDPRHGRRHGPHRRCQARHPRYGTHPEGQPQNPQEMHPSPHRQRPGEPHHHRDGRDGNHPQRHRPQGNPSRIHHRAGAGRYRSRPHHQPRFETDAAVIRLQVSGYRGQ